MIKKILLISVLLIFSCGKEKKEQQLKVVKEKKQSALIDQQLITFKKYRYFDYDRVMEAKYKVLKTGDFFAYSELELFYSYNESKKLELLPYSLIMVERHKKYKYCTDVFEDILEIFTGKNFNDYFNGEDESLIKYLKSMEQLNKVQKAYAISYLELGAKNNQFGSVRYLQVLNKYGLGVEKNLKKADSLTRVLMRIDKEQGLHYFKNR
jgi:hypothetical protein